MTGTLIDGRYLLQEAIGSGGEARVFRARDTATGNSVAVRVALKPVTYNPPDTTPSHPYWVRFFHWGVDPQHGAYQVFELLEGKTLDVVIKHRPLDAYAWSRFVTQSLDAVSALNDTGWIHGDLNAGNFFQTAGDWKLLELPFLRFEPPPNRTTLFGSIHTLAPELFEGHQADARSDLYSLGCLYYYAASGMYPHPGRNVQEVAINCLRFAPPSLRQTAPGFSGAWSDWVMSLLARQPQDRPATAATARQLLGVA